MRRAGALGEIANETLHRDFRAIDPSSADILLVEAQDQILPTYPPSLAAKAEAALQRLGVTTLKSTSVVDIAFDAVTVEHDGQPRALRARTTRWAAGVRASPLGVRLAEQTAARLDRAGRVWVRPDLTLPGHPEVFVIGDLALVADAAGRPLPGTAPVAQQQGR